MAVALGNFEGSSFFVSFPFSYCKFSTASSTFVVLLLTFFTEFTFCIRSTLFFSSLALFLFLYRLFAIVVVDVVISIVVSLSHWPNLSSHTG